MAQANCYEALFQKFWEEEWFQGGFLWKWHMINENAGGESCKKFTPQNKIALSVVSSWYAD